MKGSERASEREREREREKSERERERARAREGEREGETRADYKQSSWFRMSELPSHWSTSGQSCRC